MTKKDFELIASVLKDYHKSEQMGWGFDIDNAFADILASKNPRFQKDKFLQACGVEVNYLFESPEQTIKRIQNEI